MYTNEVVKNLVGDHFMHMFSSPHYELACSKGDLKMCMLTSDYLAVKIVNM